MEFGSWPVTSREEHTFVSILNADPILEAGFNKSCIMLQTRRWFLFFCDRSCTWDFFRQDIHFIYQKLICVPCVPKAVDEFCAQFAMD